MTTPSPQPVDSPTGPPTANGTPDTRQALLATLTTPGNSIPASHPTPGRDGIPTYAITHGTCDSWWTGLSRSDCPACNAGIEHDVHCPTPLTHNWGCGCPSDVAAAIASCPGRELVPNPCRCPCYGCKHHCGAHDPRRLAAETPGPETQPVRHAPGIAILCPDCRAKGHSVCMDGEEGADYEATTGHAITCLAVAGGASDPDCPACHPKFGIDGCTCIPFTRQGGAPRYCGPTDTVDMISGWETGGDCPHHAPAVVHPPTLLGAAELEEKLELNITPLTGNALTADEEVEPGKENEATACGPAPDACDAETGEPCEDHEREQSHAENDHSLCRRSECEVLRQS